RPSGLLLCQTPALCLAQRFLRAGAFLGVVITGDNHTGGLGDQISELNVVCARFVGSAKVHRESANRSILSCPDRKGPAAAKIELSGEMGPGLPERLFHDVRG